MKQVEIYFVGNFAEIRWVQAFRPLFLNIIIFKTVYRDGIFLYALLCDEQKLWRKL